MAEGEVEVGFPPGVGLAPTLLVYKHFADEWMGCVTPPHDHVPWGWGAEGFPRLVGGGQQGPLSISSGKDGERSGFGWGFF